MSFQSKPIIVPQLAKSFAGALSLLFLAACSSVQLQADRPAPPANLEEARQYVANRNKTLEFLEYELNEQSRACYNKFFVSSCLEDVRLQGAAIRRAHLEVQGAADDMIRLNDYAKRTGKKPNAVDPPAGQ